MADPQSTPTAHYGWAKPAVGASQDVWGGDLNGNLDSQDTTLWSIQAAQSNYLPLAGGTMTGGLTGTAGTFSGNVRWASGNIGAAVAQLASNAGNPIVQLAANYYEQLSISTGLRAWVQNGVSAMTLDINGNLGVLGTITANGWVGRQGVGGAPSAYTNNFNWTGSALQLWIGAVNAGNITVTSDYRAKKDIEPLPSMWDAVKALSPISFTYQDYTPAIELERDANALPLIVGSDEEHWGFIAHELQETLIPSAASGVKDAPNEIQSPNAWPVIATLTKALQEAMARIEALEANR